MQEDMKLLLITFIAIGIAFIICDANAIRGHRSEDVESDLSNSCSSVNADVEHPGYCEEWKDAGDCKPGSEWYQWMQENCAKTCADC